MTPTDDRSAEGAPDELPTDHATRDQLRAMAHPLRLEIMERVGRRGAARAADIAADLGIPANSVSYHLRILARGGVIEEAPEAARDRRDRVWRLTQINFQHRRHGDSGDTPGTENGEYDDASGAATLAVFDLMRTAWSAELVRARGSGTAQDGLGTMTATSVRLSREQMRELNETVTATIQEYSRINRDETGADLPGDPASGGEALTYRVLWTSLGEPGPDRPSADSADG